LRLVSLAFGLREGWQQHSRQDGDDGDHNEQLDQREGGAVFPGKVHNK
jgi:hypothetical protein